MNAPSLVSQSPPESAAADLDTRILRVEQRLIAREQTLRRGIDGVASRIRHTLQPLRRVLPATGMTLAVAALGTLAWRWRRPGPPGRSAADAAAHPVAADRQGAGDFSWVGLAALGWPLLPAAWRARVSPATASTLVAVGLPMLEWLLHGRAPLPPATMPSVDLARFAGSWFVLAQLPRRFGALGAPGDGLSVLQYAPRADGQIDVRTGRAGAAPGEAPIRGVAQVVPGSAGAKLALSFWPVWLQVLSPAWGDHWILHVDEGFSVALVGSADRDQLFVLSRSPQIDPQRMAELRQRARDQGFQVERLEFATTWCGVNT